MISEKRAWDFTSGFIISLFISIISTQFIWGVQPKLGFICLLSSFIVGLYRQLNKKEKFDWIGLLISTLAGSLFFFA